MAVIGEKWEPDWNPKQFGDIAVWGYKTLEEKLVYIQFGEICWVTNKDLPPQKSFWGF